MGNEEAAVNQFVASTSMRHRSITPTQTIGIPTISEIITNGTFSNHPDQIGSIPIQVEPSSTVPGDPAIAGAVGSGVQNTELQRIGPQKSLEDESDHEYYNDFDRLQRELQPLRKSETTV